MSGLLAEMMMNDQYLSNSDCGGSCPSPLAMLRTILLVLVVMMMMLPALLLHVPEAVLAFVVTVLRIRLVEFLRLLVYAATWGMEKIW